MNYPDYSTGALKGMHAGIRKALQADDATPVGEEMLYGVREYPDWADARDIIETELARRGVKFDPILW